MTDLEEISKEHLSGKSIYNRTLYIKGDLKISQAD